MPSLAAAYLVFRNAVSVEFRGQDASSLFGKAIDARPLSHEERMRLDASARDATFFSAKVSDAKLLEQMRDYVAKASAGESGYHRGDFIKRMRTAMGVPADAQLNPDAPVTDLRSSRRLGLIYDFQKERLDAEVRAKQLQDPDFAHWNPAQELVRVEDRERPRDWTARWREAGGKFYAGGRMIAPVDDPIWARISRFGSPLPPFDFNSGMGLEFVDRDEAIALGVIAQDGAPQDAEDDGSIAERRRSNLPGAEELPESQDLPKTPALEKAAEKVEMPQRPERIETVRNAEDYAARLLHRDGVREREVDFSLATPEQARTIAQSLENAKRAGLLDAAGISKITVDPASKDAYGMVDKKTGEMSIFTNSFDLHDGRIAPIHEIVHMFNNEIDANDKLKNELLKMHRGYKRKIAGLGWRTPPLDSIAERKPYEFLSDSVAYYLCGGNVFGYGEKCFLFLQKVIKLRGKI